MKLSPSVNHQQRQSDEPVEFARLLVTAGVEDPRHVQEHRQHHQVRAPAVNVADEAARRDHEVNVLDRVVGQFHAGLVVHHQQDSGDDRDHEASGGDQAQAEGVARASVRLMRTLCMCRKRLWKVLCERFAVGLWRLPVAEAGVLHGMRRRLLRFSRNSGLGRAMGAHTRKRVPFGTSDSAFTCNWPSAARRFRATAARRGAGPPTTEPSVEKRDP